MNLSFKQNYSLPTLGTSLNDVTNTLMNKSTEVKSVHIFDDIFLYCKNVKFRFICVLILQTNMLL